MLELFLDYCYRGKIEEALLIGHNLVNREPDNQKAFEAYFDYLISLAKESEIDEAKLFAQQANGVLTFFSENTEMDEAILELILNKKKQLNDVWQIINNADGDRKRQAIENENKYYDDALELIEKILNQTKKCDTEKEFNNCIDNLGKVDQSIDQEHLNSKQKNMYIKLTKMSADIVSLKSAYFEKKKNQLYNLNAIETYKKVFDMFKSGSIVDEHKELLKALFTFDMSRLYNETLVYYNHVYNYVLNKLSDDDKFLITKYAMMCEKR